MEFFRKSLSSRDFMPHCGDLVQERWSRNGLLTGGTRMKLGAAARPDFGPPSGPEAVPVS
jgi:hypothetical protein